MAESGFVLDVNGEWSVANKYLLQAPMRTGR